MILIGKQLPNGNFEGEVVCFNCATTAPIELWSVEPLNYAMPAGWTRFNSRGQLWSYRCPVCTQRAQEVMPAALP